VLVEVILQLLVGIVDTELLEAVGLKVLKAEYIQDTDGQALENRTRTHTQKTYGMSYILTSYDNHRSDAVLQLSVS